MANRGDVFSRLDAKRREQTPQALARLMVVSLFVGLWFVLWLARIPMPVPFLLVLLAEILFFLVYWRTVFILRKVRSIELAHYVMLAAEIVFHTTIVYFLGGASWLGAFAYVFGLIFANTFLDLRRGALYTAGASLAFGALVLLEATGAIPPYRYLSQGALRYTDARFVTTTLVAASGVFFSIYLWVNWVGHQLRAERDSAVRAQDDLLDARAQLQRANVELEERVQARTSALEHANAALRESQQQLNLVLETCPDLIAIQEPDGRYRFINSAFKTVLGYGPGDLVGKSAADLIHPDDLDGVVERFRNMTQTAQAGEATFRFRHADGHWLSMEANGQVLVDESGRPTGVVVVLRDATERRRAEEALRESEERFRRLAENAVDIIFRYRLLPLPGFEYVSPAIISVLGYTPEEIYADPQLAPGFVHPDDLQGLGRLAVANATDPLTLRLFDRSGSLVWIEFRTVPVHNEAGETIAVEGIARDVSERKRAEEALLESESKFRTMAETVAAATFIFQGATMRYVNSAAEAVTGYSRSELLKMSFLGLVHPQFQDLVTERGAHRSRAEQAPNRYEVKLVRKNGQERWVDFTAGRIEFEGQPAILGTAFDITERKRAENALREQARRDPLTGLLNHVAIVDELRDVITGNPSAAPHAVAMVDVDGLKAVNDTYGHQMGDLVLLAVARTLTRSGAIVGRYGGDEFVALLKDTDRAAAERYREGVVSALASASLTDLETGAAVPVFASIGLAVYPDEAGTIEELIRLSDSAMYTWRRQRAALPGEFRPAGPLAGDRSAEMIGELMPLLTSPSNLDEKLRLVAHQLSVGAGYDAVQFTVTIDPANPKPIATTFGLSRELAKAWRQELIDRPPQPHPIHQLLEENQRPVIIDDPWNDERFLPAQRKILRAAGLRSVLVAPMLWQSTLIGSLSVAAKREHAFASRDAQFLSSVATQVTAIVRMATLVEELQTSAGRLVDAQTETVLLLASVAEAHDSTAGRHLQNVRALAESLARELGHSDERARDLGLAATLHDIGKIRVPDALLRYTGPLDAEQWELIKQHTVWGGDLLAGRPAFELAATIARCHHERWDGTGYPAALAGGAIPEPAAIVAVADAFDAMVSGRPYRKSKSIAFALREIERCSGGQFSPGVVEALLRLHKRRRLPISRERPHEHAA